MKPQKIIDIDIKLKKKTMSDVSLFANSLQNIVKLYSTACRQLGVAEHSPQLTSVGKDKISIRGLRIPVRLTREVVEQFPKLAQRLKYDDSELGAMFEHVTKGLDKVANNHLDQHAKNSLNYWIEKNRKGV